MATDGAAQTRSKSYWRDRADETSKLIRESEAKALAEITRESQRATREIVGRIDTIFNNYRYRYQLTADEARAELAAPASQEEYLRMWAKLETLDPLSAEYMGLARQASARPYAWRISREAAMLSDTRLELARVAQTQYNATTEYLKEAFGMSADAVYEQLKERLGAQAAAMLTKPSAEFMQKVLSESWSGMNYSERIWKSMDALETTLTEVMTGGLLTGRSSEDMAQDISQRMGVGLSNARRLVRTESTYVNNQVALESYKQAGVEYYEYLTAKDERVCEVCGPLDGQRFRVDKAVIGENLPPMHPNCRCSTVASVDEKAEEDARKETEIPDYGRRVLDDYGYKLERKSVIIKTKAMRSLTVAGSPNAIADLTNESGDVLQRRFYDSLGNAALDIDTTDHGNPSEHPQGAHAHDWAYKAGRLIRQMQRKLTLLELKAIVDLLKGREPGV